MRVARQACTVLLQLLTIGDHEIVCIGLKLSHLIMVIDVVLKRFLDNPEIAHDEVVQ